MLIVLYINIPYTTIQQCNTYVNHFMYIHTIYHHPTMSCQDENMDMDEDEDSQHSDDDDESEILDDELMDQLHHQRHHQHHVSKHYNDI